MSKQQPGYLGQPSPYATVEETAAVMAVSSPSETWLHNQLDRLAPHRHEMGSAGDTAALTSLTFELRDKLALVELAIHEYHAALDQREHGGVAQSRAIAHIENLLGIHWRASGDEPVTKPDAALVHQVAQGLIFIADEAGMVVTVERTPRQPLAMGHADYVVEVRPARGKQ